jgi:hypothetical protein
LTTTEEDLRGEHRYQLDPQARILGNIVDANTGSAITRYQYRVSGPVQRVSSAVSVSGAFEVDQLPAGAYTVVVEADGYEAGTQELVSVDVGQTVKNVVIRMKPAGTIVGRVYGGRSANMTIVAFSEDQEGESRGSVAEDGSFSLSDLVSGTYTLTLVDEDGATRGEAQSIRVQSGGVTRGVEISMMPSNVGEGVDGLSEAQERRF